METMAIITILAFIIVCIMGYELEKRKYSRVGVYLINRKMTNAHSIGIVMYSFVKGATKTDKMLIHLWNREIGFEIIYF